MHGRARGRAPLWLMGFGNTVFGLVGGFLVLPLPQMLAAMGVPEVRIAAVSAACFSPGFWVFLLGPMLDLHFSRRWWTSVTAVVSGATLALAISLGQHLFAMEALLMLAYAAAVLSSNAFLGWMASIVPAEDEARLSAWTQVGSFAGGALMAWLAGEALRGLPLRVAAVALGVLVVLPTIVLPWCPLPEVEEVQAKQMARESFAQFFREVAAVLRRRDVLEVLGLFLLPVGSFALTNLLSGVGGEFRASDAFVSRMGGAVLALAGAVGCLLLPLFARRFRPLLVYLGLGAVGAVFTLCLLLLPRAPWVFAVAFLGENALQAMAFTAEVAIIFRVIGRDNPLAATQFSLLSSATVLPILYMGVLDGRAYGAHRLTGALVIDGGVGLLACGLATMALARRSRHRALVTADLAEVTKE